jgi:hypothetical protein
MMFAIVICAPAGALAGADLSRVGARMTVVAQDEPEAVPPADDRILTLSGWDGSFSLGLNGASGNNENFNFRSAFEAKKETSRHEARFGARYTYATSDGEDSANRFVTNGRFDWLLNDSPWRVYFGASYEFDEFQDWDHRVSFGPGVGYQAIETERTDLLLRFGVLATREFGGSDDTWTPELNLGFDFEHQLTERQKLAVVFDYYPSLEDLTEYRFVGTAAWRIEMDPEANLFLEVGVEDRYDSSPGPDTKRNDIAYYASVGWSF